MSKIGNLPIFIPEGVTVSVENEQVIVDGPKGKLKENLLKGIEIEQENNSVVVKVVKESEKIKAFHGLMRSLIDNMVVGVTKGWEKKLELVGTGYRVALQGRTLVLSIGYSHPVNIDMPEGIEFKLDGQTKLTIEGISKQLVGQVAAKIRAVRPPEPYKGKGIRYKDEKVRRKAGKAASGSAG